MEKQRLLIQSILMIAPLVTSPIALAGTVAPTSPTTSPTVDVPACYFKTSSGQLIDLTDKCGFIKPAACASSLGSFSRDKVLATFCQQNKKCVLTNTCGDMPRGINTPPPGTPMGFTPSKQTVA